MQAESSLNSAGLALCQCASVPAEADLCPVHVFAPFMLVMRSLFLHRNAELLLSVCCAQNLIGRP